MDTRLALAILLTWGTASTLGDVCREASEATERLTSREFEDLMTTLTAARWCTEAPERKPLSLEPDALPSDSSARFVSAVAGRLSFQRVTGMVDKFIWDYSGDDPSVLQFMFNMGFATATQDEHAWDRYVAAVRDAYARCPHAETWDASPSLERRARENPLPLEVARRVVGDASAFPLALVGVSEEACRTDVAKRILPVGDVAVREGWFA
jgi:hypothetical protein